ncbi:hypothetical protein C8J57DRAFT_1171212 [Mycena rebaudengoi]|nr:hypothetical protein C8J57DRAFT_1171212 [Mycena rebaudengoi]
MYRSPSPFSAENQNRHAQPYSGQIGPGQVTYTTSTGPDGRVIYHPFKAVAASYQTPNGVVHGIQWVPAEATQVLPPGAQPANSDFAASWARGTISKEEQKALKEWQRDEEKRRKKEEKEAKRQREKEQRSGGHGDGESELRKARERDAQTRERRKSFNQGGAVPSSLAFPLSGGASGGYPAGYSAAPQGYPAPTNPGYPTTAYTAGYNGVPPQGYEQRDRKHSTGVSDLDRQLGDLNLGTQEGGLPRPSRYQTEADRARKMSNNFGPGDRPAYTTSGSYTGSYTGAGAYPSHNAGNPYPNPSPNMRPGEAPAYGVPYGNPNYPPAGPQMVRPTTPYGGHGQNVAVYPPGHIMEGKPIPRSRATTPIQGSGGLPGASYPAGAAVFPAGMQMADPNAADQGQLAAPEGFSRPINAAQAFTPFETMKIQDMDDLIQNAPRMPVVLGTHDVFASDWNRMMQDLCLAWTGRLPAPGRPQRKTTLAADLIDLWNVSFFFPRGIEVVLYKGRERRSGPQAGLVDIQLPTYPEHDDISSSSSDDSDDSDSDDGARYPPAAYMYGQQNFPGQGSMAEVLEQRRRRQEMRAEKKRRRKEKKIRRKAKAREKKFALYLTCVPNGGPAMAGSVSGGMPMGAQGMGNTMGMGMMHPGMMGAGASGMGMAGHQMSSMNAGQMGAMGTSMGGMPAGGMGAHGMSGMGGGPGMSGVGYGAVAGGMPMSNQGY